MAELVPAILTGSTEGFAGTESTETATVTTTGTTIATSTVIATTSPSPTYFYTNWILSENPLPLNQAVSYNYTYYSSTPPTGEFTLYLCQSNTNTTPTHDNTWAVLEFQMPTQTGLFPPNLPVLFEEQFSLATTDTKALNWPFFFCWAVGPDLIDFTCESFSESFFMVSTSADKALRDVVRDNASQKTISIPPTPLSVARWSQVLSLSTNLNLLPTGDSTVTTPFTATNKATTVTVGPSQSTNSSPSSSNSLSTQTSTPQSTSGGLSRGGKAAIAIGIIALFFLIALGAYVYFRRRGSDARPGNPPLRPNTHELVTQANRHELSTKANIHEMAQEKQGVMTVLEKKAEKPISFSDINTPRERDSTHNISSPSELDGRNLLTHTR